MYRLIGLLIALIASAVQAKSGWVVNAKIHTLDDATPKAEAMAWDAQGKIIAIGDEKTVRAAVNNDKPIDANGAVIIPGLIDAHAHLMGLGYALMRADLVDTTSKQDIIDRLKAFEKTLPADAWLLGRGWDQNDWPEKKFPTAADLDAAFPSRPVWLERVDGHASWANSAAIRLAKRDLSGDWQPDGGRIERVDGKSTGVFVDAAAGLIEAVVPAPNQLFREQALERALQAAAKNGLTGVHDMGTSLADLALYRQFNDQGKFTMRLAAYADGNNAALDALCAMGLYRHPNGRLQMRGLKLYADGALGSRGAALLEDYSDDHGNRGLLVTSEQDLRTAMQKAQRCGVQIATHAIGDRGNQLVLNLYQEILGNDAEKVSASINHRWRVEHAQVVAMQDIPRFAKLAVIASMQPTHATSDMPWAGDRVGEKRLAGAYAWREFINSDARLALGSDFPVESVDPRLGLYAAVTRQDRAGMPPGGWLAVHKLTAIEALKGFTRDAAYASFDENEVGRLKVGMRADFVLLDSDPLTIDPQKLDELKVLSTWVDGQAVYRDVPNSP